MDCHQVDAELATGLHRLRGGVGNVVELEIEEDLLAKGLDCLDDIWSLGRVEFKPNLVEVHGVAKQLHLRLGLRTGLHIQRNNQFTHLFTPSRFQCPGNPNRGRPRRPSSQIP